MPRDAILVVDKNPKFLEKTREILVESDHPMLEAEDAAAARVVLSRDRPAIVLSNVLLSAAESGFDLCRHIKKNHDEAVPVVLMLANDDAETVAKVFQSGAENYLVRPLKRNEVLSCLRDMVLIRSLLVEKKRWRDTQGAQLGEGTQPVVLGSGGAEGVDPITQFYQFEFFKKLISIELKRAQRYAFPLAVVLVALDDHPELHGPQGATLSRELASGLAQAIRRSIRDIDVPVSFTDGNILLMMPHTDVEGAMTVARRIHGRVRKSAHRAGAVEIRPTVSVGVTSSRRVERLTFAALMQKVTAALRDARKAGGDSVSSA
jgi:two-component system cell cycle response regulator